MNKLSYETLIAAGNYFGLMPATPAGFIWLAEKILENSGILAVSMVYNEDGSVNYTL